MERKLLILLTQAAEVMDEICDCNECAGCAFRRKIRRQLTECRKVGKVGRAVGDKLKIQLYKDGPIGTAKIVSFFTPEAHGLMTVRLTSEFPRLAKGEKIAIGEAEILETIS